MNKNSVISTATAAILIFLMASSVFIVFSNPAATTVKAQTTTDQTSIPSNLLQYEWTSDAASPERSFFNAGPAPNTPSIAWRAEIPLATGWPVAFNGMVFVSDFYGNTYALNASTGSIIWEIPISASAQLGGICKIDDTYMVLANTCVYIANGSTVWVGPPGFSCDQTPIDEAGYVPELHMFMGYTCAWNLPNPAQPPTLAWNLTSQQNVGHGYGVYGDGMMFIGSEDGYLRAYNATTGTIIWKTPLSAAFNYGASYYNGMVIQGGLDDNMRAWNATTGQLIWTYSPHTYYGQWASATGVAYGMVYEHNQDTYLYAINATTGQLVWRVKGPGIGYSNILSIADGKVYIQMGDSQYRDPATGQYAYDEFDCYNAYTGQLIWTMPMANGAPFDQQCIAYGNLYVIPTSLTPTAGVWSYTLMSPGTSIGEVWCISSTPANWPMFMNDPAHTAYGSGPTDLALQWKTPTGGEVVASPTLVNGVCYVGSLDGNIYALDATEGTELWSFQTGFEVASSVAVVNGLLYTGADSGSVYCLNATTGQLVWKTYAGGITNNLLGEGSYLTIEPPVRSSPIVYNGVVYVGSLDGNLYALDANTGAVLWKFQTPGPIFATPSIVGNAVYFDSNGGSIPVYLNSAAPALGYVYKLDMSGNLIWQEQIQYWLNRTAGWGNSLFASPTVAAGMVFVRNGFLDNFALNATTGQTIWDYEAIYNAGTPSQSGGVIQMGATLYAYGALYINDYYGISCLNATDGSRLWYTYLSREDVAEFISYSFDRIYVVTQAGVLFVLNALTGAKESYYYFGNLQMSSAPVPYNDSIYMGTNDWNVYCFGEARTMSASAASAASPSVSALQAQAPSIITQETPATASSTPTIAYVTLMVTVAIIATAAASVLIFRKRK